MWPGEDAMLLLATQHACGLRRLATNRTFLINLNYICKV